MKLKRARIPRDLADEYQHAADTIRGDLESGLTVQAAAVLTDARRSAAIQIDALTGRASVNVGR